MLKLFRNTYVTKLQSGFNRLSIRSSGGRREHGNEFSGCMKCEPLLDQLSDCQLLKDGGVSLCRNVHLAVLQLSSLNA